MDVFGGPTKLPTGAQEPEVHRDGARRPDLAIGATLGTEHSVEDPVGISDDIEGNAQVRAVGGKAFGRCESDDGDVCVTEEVEVIAHGDHVFLAWQSSEVSVQDQHERSAAHVSGSPWPTVVVDEFEVGKRVADVQQPGGVHDGAQVRPMRLAACSIAATSPSMEPAHASRSSEVSSTTSPVSVSATTTGA